MLRPFVMLLCLIGCTVNAAFATPDTAIAAADNATVTADKERLDKGRLDKERLDESNWTKVFDCEFDQKSDLDKWTKSTDWKNANDELQAYIADSVSVRDGVLAVTAKTTDIKYGGKLRHYTSGRLDTYKKFDIKYGRFDIRFKVPKGKGLWPAFWMLPSSGSWPPEIDWMEICGDKPETLLVTNHYGIHKDGNHKEHSIRWQTTPDFAQEFHTITGIWNENEIVAYVDGKKVSESREGVPHEKFYLILNLAVGGGLPGNPDETTVFPADYLIDYVRVYEPAKRSP